MSVCVCVREREREREREAKTAGRFPFRAIRCLNIQLTALTCDIRPFVTPYRYTHNA